MIASAIPHLSDQELFDEYMQAVSLLDALEVELVSRGETMLTRADAYRKISELSDRLKGRHQ